MPTESESEMLAFEERIADYGARIDPIVRELFPREGAVLGDAVWHHMGTGGKRIRPAICLLTCEQFGGDSALALPFAAAVEILHNMLLVHDDVEDGDTIRRNRETVWVKYGVNNAINVGDYMLGIAYAAIGRTEVDEARLVALYRAFTDAYVVTTRGQDLDMNSRARPDLTVDDYIEMVTLKTGRYMGIGLIGGAIVAGADRAHVDALTELGDCMGAAFQIRDDVIDLTVGKGRGGALGNDIREGKPSILYAHALKAAEAADAERLVDVAAGDRDATTEADVQWVIDLYARCGTMEFARSEADRLMARAHAIAADLPVADAAFFPLLTRYMVWRSK